MSNKYYTQRHVHIYGPCLTTTNSVIIQTHDSAEQMIFMIGP